MSLSLLVPLIFVTVSAHRLPILSNSEYAEGLRRNIADHAREIAKSEELGFRRASAAAAVVPPTTAHSIARSALGMGSQCPFDGDNLVHACSEPLLTPDECDALRT